MKRIFFNDFLANDFAEKNAMIFFKKRFLNCVAAEDSSSKANEIQINFSNSIWFG